MKVGTLQGANVGKLAAGQGAKGGVNERQILDLN